MKTCWLVLTAVVVLLWSAIPAPAQVRYTDAEGIVHFVDSLNAVPEKYRASAHGTPSPKASSSSRIDWEQKARDQQMEERAAEKRKLTDDMFRYCDLAYGQTGRLIPIPDLLAEMKALLQAGHAPNRAQCDEMARSEMRQILGR